MLDQYLPHSYFGWINVLAFAHIVSLPFLVNSQLVVLKSDASQLLSETCKDLHGLLLNDFVVELIKIVWVQLRKDVFLGKLCVIQRLTVNLVLSSCVRFDLFTVLNNLNLAIEKIYFNDALLDLFHLLV